MEPQTSKAPIHSSPYQGEAGWGFSYAQPPKNKTLPRVAGEGQYLKQRGLIRPAGWP
jgi:hypothetical protein